MEFPNHLIPYIWDGNFSKFLLAPTTLPSSGLLPPASLSTCIRSSPSGMPFTTGARFASRRLARQGETVRGWSGVSQGGAGGVRVRIRTGCWIAWRFGGIWGAGGEDIGGQLPLLADTELVLVGWCGGGNGWLARSRESSSGAVMGFVGGPS